eukprot:symbB.v1.2.026006.t2/scaffold2565.1/size76241/2
MGIGTKAKGKKVLQLKTFQKQESDLEIVPFDEDLVQRAHRALTASTKSLGGFWHTPSPCRHPLVCSVCGQSRGSVTTQIDVPHQDDLEQSQVLARDDQVVLEKKVTDMQWQLRSSDQHIVDLKADLKAAILEKQVTDMQWQLRSSDQHIVDLKADLKAAIGLCEDLHAQLKKQTDEFQKFMIRIRATVGHWFVQQKELQEQIDELEKRITPGEEQVAKLAEELSIARQKLRASQRRKSRRESTEHHQATIQALQLRLKDLGHEDGSRARRDLEKVQEQLRRKEEELLKAEAEKRRLAEELESEKMQAKDKAVMIEEAVEEAMKAMHQGAENAKLDEADGKGRVRKELKDDPGQCKLDKITEEIKLYRKLFDKDDFHFLQAYRREAKMLTKLGRYKEAERAWKKVWEESEKKFQEDDRIDTMTIEAQQEFAKTLQLQRKFKDAETNQREVLRKAKKYLEEDHPGHPVTLGAMQELALTLWQLGMEGQSKQLPEAQALYEEVLDLYPKLEDKMVKDVKQKIEGIKNGKNPKEIQQVSGGSSGSERKKHVMLSGRFNDQKKIDYMNKVKELLDEEGIDTYMVSCQTGEKFSGKTMFGLYHAKAMVVFGTDDYGAKTGAGYETFYELQYAWENQLDLIPIQLSSMWPPKPDKDKGDAGKIQNKYVLSSAQLREKDEKMEKPDEMAKKIAKAVRGFDEADTKVGYVSEAASSTYLQGAKEVRGDPISPMEMMTKGVEIWKLCAGKGEWQRRHLALTPGPTAAAHSLKWSSDAKYIGRQYVGRPTSVNIKEVEHVRFGAEALPTSQQNEEANPWCCFSVRTAQRSFHFKAKGEQIAENFVLGLSRLCHLDHPIRQLDVVEEKLKKRLKEVAEKKKQIQAIEVLAPNPF